MCLKGIDDSSYLMEYCDMLFHIFTEDNCYTYALNDKHDPSSVMWFE